MNDEITRTLKKYGRADVPTYLKEITFLRGLLAEAYTELSTIEAATLIPGGQDEIDGLLDLVRRIQAEVDGVRQAAVYGRGVMEPVFLVRNENEYGEFVVLACTSMKVAEQYRSEFQSRADDETDPEEWYGTYRIVKMVPVSIFDMGEE